MKDRPPLNPLPIAIGATFAVTLTATSLASAEESPFAVDDLPRGYMLAQNTSDDAQASDDGQAAMKEGSCGEGKCGEGSCGADMSKPLGELKVFEGQCGEGSNMILDMDGGMVMNQNNDQLPRGCNQVSEDVKFTVKAGREYAKPFNGSMYAFDNQEWSVAPCARVTVTFINEDHVRHQWMVHGLPKYIYPLGMFHLESTGPDKEVTGTFIVPSTAKTYLVHCEISQHMENGLKAQLKVGGGDGDLPSIPGISGPPDLKKILSAKK